jgi:hypothetical protein
MLYDQNKISKVIGSFNLWPPLLHAFPPVPNLAVKVVITKFSPYLSRSFEKHVNVRAIDSDSGTGMKDRNDVNEEFYTLATVRRGLGNYADQRSPTSASILPRPM